MPFPNKDTQFKPGQSGNPAGKPKGALSLSTHIQNLLNDEGFVATIREGLQLKEYKGVPIKAMVRAQILLAVNGDNKAFDLLAKYGYGTPQESEADEINIKFEVVNRVPKPKEK